MDSRTNKQTFLKPPRNVFEQPHDPLMACIIPNIFNFKYGHFKNMSGLVRPGNLPKLMSGRKLVVNSHSDVRKL